MNEQLTLKELAPYLPYGLKMYYADGNEFYIDNLTGVDVDCCRIDGDVQSFPIDHKPILRPMSDFKIDICKNSFINENNIDDDWFLEAIKYYHKLIYADFQNLSYRSIEFLFKNHFDVFRLIDKGLAIDINTIEL